MEREVSRAVQLAVSLIAMSVVLLLVMGTVYIGNELKVDVINKAVDSQTRLETGQLRSLSTHGGKIMPKAAIYSIVSKERNGVSLITLDGVTYAPNQTGRWANQEDADDEVYIFPEDIILNSLDGKVTVKVDDNKDGFYSVDIESIQY